MKFHHLLLLTAFLCSPALAFVTGLNQAWLKNNYGHSFNDGYFDAADARRILQASHDAGGKVMRVWVFEGDLKGQVQFDGRRPIGVWADVVKNLRNFLTMAREEQVQIYLTLFDGNVSAFANTQDNKDRYWNILNDKYGYGQNFLDQVLAPVLALNQDVPGSIFGIDLCNEINAFVEPWGGPWFEKGWPGVNAFARKWGDYIRAHSNLKVSASLGWSKPERLLLAGKLNDANLDFFDFHQYNNSGNIPNCSDLTRLGKPVYLGEFGQLSGSYDDDLQDEVTNGFLTNAHDCGLQGAFAWRLSEGLPASTRGDYLSYESYGRWRPAFETFKLLSILYNSGF